MGMIVVKDASISASHAFDTSTAPRARSGILVALVLGVDLVHKNPAPKQLQSGRAGQRSVGARETFDLPCTGPRNGFALPLRP